MGRDARGKVLGDGEDGFDALTGRHEAGWRLAVTSVDAATKTDAVHLLVVTVHGSVETVSAHDERGRTPEGGQRADPSRN